jgi:hypothetical protein
LPAGIGLPGFPAAGRGWHVGTTAKRLAPAGTGSLPGGPRGVTSTRHVPEARVGSRYWLRDEPGQVVDVDHDLVRVQIAGGILKFSTLTHYSLDPDWANAVWFTPER